MKKEEISGTTMLEYVYRYIKIIRKRKSLSCVPKGEHDSDE